MAAEEVSDFHGFDGNAEGFRILMRTGARNRAGGMRPSLATLGAMAKYPRPSLLPDGALISPLPVAQKKLGYFQNDRDMACTAFRALGMQETLPGVFSRHPLAFLTEAADDVCNIIADLEDGFKLGILTFQEVRDALIPIAEEDQGFGEITYGDPAGRIGRIRASALAVLVSTCAKAFREHLDDIEQGRLQEPLLKVTPWFAAHENIKALLKKKVYQYDIILQIEYAGYQTIGGLLDMFYGALRKLTADSPKEYKLRKLLPLDFLWRPGVKGKQRASSDKDDHDFYLSRMTPYARLLAVTDYISGMTDRFAVQLYQKLSGIRLPD